MEYKIGDTVERTLPSKIFGNPIIMTGIVLFVGDDIISCSFISDQVRTMRFYKSTGIDVLGREFGSYRKI